MKQSLPVVCRQNGDKEVLLMTDTNITSLAKEAMFLVALVS